MMLFFSRTEDRDSLELLDGSLKSDWVGPLSIWVGLDPLVCLISFMKQMITQINTD